MDKANCDIQHMSGDMRYYEHQNQTHYEAKLKLRDQLKGKRDFSKNPAKIILDTSYAGFYGT